MKFCSNYKMSMVLVAFLLAIPAAFGQSQGTPQQPSQPAPSQTPGQKPSNPQVAPLTLDSVPTPVSAEEDAAIKAFRESIKEKDPANMEKLGEDFVQKYPQSRYRVEVYSMLVRGYFSSGQVDKMEAAGDKELALEPNDPQTLALVGSTLPRAMNSSTPEPQKRLAKAEQYCQKALDMLPSQAKPDNMSEDVFLNAKSQTAALAHSGLGLVAFRRGQYAAAIPHLEESIKLDSQPDPVDYYLLGLSNEKSSHFEDAVAAFTKCAAIPGGLQATCTQNIEEAKKLAATQLSAPK
jgi:tetratricopeptide (TPR) repeat protein